MSCFPSADHARKFTERFASAGSSRTALCLAFSHVPKNHRGFPAVCDGQKGAVGGPGQAGDLVGRRGRRADDEDALRDVPDANHALRTPHRNIHVVGRPGERREIKLGIHQGNSEFSGGRIEEADDAVMAARGIQLVIRAELTGAGAAPTRRERRIFRASTTAGP